VLCSGPNFAPNNPAELVAYGKKTAGEVTFAAAGGVVRLAPLLFAQRTGLQMTGVTYRGSTQAHPDLMAGRVDVMFDTVPAALAHIRSGALKALATTGPQRAPQLPDVPTMAEALLPGFEAQTWGMVIGPANIPAALLAKLSEDCAAAIRRPEVVERHKALGAEVGTSTPEETRRYVESELQKWGQAARNAGIEAGAPT
jgi:tripartite-type tricarboxylate transporter receptor subunit TctC